MGYIGTFGTEFKAPEHHCNTFGTPNWSGKNQDEFNPELEQELRDFIKREALRKGNNDRIQKCVGENQSLFNEKFLSGWPHELWLEFYNKGILGDKEKILSRDEIWPPMPI